MPKDPTKSKKKAAKIAESGGEPVAEDVAALAKAVDEPTANEAADAEPEEDVPILSKKEQRKAKKRSEAGLDPIPLADKKVHDTAALAHAPQAVKTSQYGVWIGNLNFTTSANALKNWLASNILSAQGEIVRVNLPAGQNGKNKG